MLSRTLVTALTVLITLAWSVNVVFGFIDPVRHDPTLNAIFGIVVGGVFALRRTGGKHHVSAVRAELGRLISGEHAEAEPDDEPDDDIAEPEHHTGDLP